VRGFKDALRDAPPAAPPAPKKELPPGPEEPKV
jgi:hypothetical protein